MRRPVGRLLILLGLTLTTFAYLVFQWMRFLHGSEKRNMLYLFGHGWDLEWEVIFPCAVAGGNMLLIARLIFPRLVEPGRCRECGYDLRATPGRCPECGTQFAAKQGGEVPDLS